MINTFNDVYTKAAIEAMTEETNRAAYEKRRKQEEHAKLLQAEIGEYADFEPEEALNLPEFPLHCLPGPMADFVTQAAVSVQCSASAVAAAVLGTTSIAARENYCVKAGGELSSLDQKGLNLFIFVAMPSGAGKSGIAQLLKQPIIEGINQYNTENRNAIAMNRHKRAMYENAIAKKSSETNLDKMAAALEDIATLEEKLATLPTIAHLELPVNDITPTELANLMARNNGFGAIITTEGKLIGTIGGRYEKGSAPDIDIFNNGYSGEPYDKRRATSEDATIDRAILSMLVFAQIDVLEELMTPFNTQRGLTARWLYSIHPEHHRRLLANTRAISEDAQAAYATCLTHILQTGMASPATIDLTLSDAARDAMIAYNDASLQPRRLEDLAKIPEYAARAIGHLMRIAANLHLLETGADGIPQREISLDTMQRAIEINEYFIIHAKAAHLAIPTCEQGDDGRYVLDKIMAHSYQDTLGVRMIDFTTLRKRCKNRLNKAGLERVLNQLCAKGYLRWYTHQPPQSKAIQCLRMNPLADAYLTGRPVATAQPATDRQAPAIPSVASQSA